MNKVTVVAFVFIIVCVALIASGLQPVKSTINGAVNNAQDTLVDAARHTNAPITTMPSAPAVNAVWDFLSDVANGGK